MSLYVIASSVKRKLTSNPSNPGALNITGLRRLEIVNILKRKLVEDSTIKKGELNAHTSEDTLHERMLEVSF